MKIPDEVSLLSLFECEPTLLDDGVPFCYNEATYRFSNQSNEDFCISISPPYHELKVSVTLSGSNELISVLDISNIEAIEIISDKKDESKIMLTTPNSIIKINFKPKYKIFINQFYE